MYIGMKLERLRIYIYTYKMASRYQASREVDLNIFPSWPPFR